MILSLFVAMKAARILENFLCVRVLQCPQTKRRLFHGQSPTILGKSSTVNFVFVIITCDLVLKIPLFVMFVIALGPS